MTVGGMGFIPERLLGKNPCSVSQPVLRCQGAWFHFHAVHIGSVGVAEMASPQSGAIIASP